MNKILFVINTLGTGGAEVALLEMLRKIDTSKYDVSLFVLLNQGELLPAVPEGIKLLNKNFDNTPIHTRRGLRRLKRKALAAFFKDFNGFKYLGYMTSNFREMQKAKDVRLDKLMWRVVAAGAPVFDEKFDLAVAYIEGGSTYYVKDFVNATVKKVFVHTDYSLAGYSRKLDMECYSSFDRIYAVSDSVKRSFLKVYPELFDKTDVFSNLIDISAIEKRSLEPGGFDDGFAGIRILSIGRLTQEKAFETAVDAMEMLVRKGLNARWYVFGEGELRAKLEDRIKNKGLEGVFFLPGNTDNPYPYLKQCDIYVQASRYEGKSLAIQEAKVLKCPVIVTDCGGNREQITDGVDGLICGINAKDMCEKIVSMLSDFGKAREMGLRAYENIKRDSQSYDRIEELIGRP